MDYEIALEPLRNNVEEIEELIHCSVDDMTSKLIEFVYGQIYYKNFGSF